MMKTICFDIETTGLDQHSDVLLGVAFSAKPLEAFYVTIPENAKKAKMVLRRLKPILENPEVVKIGHNLKFEIKFLRAHGINLKGPLVDTMVMGYLLRPGIASKQHRLKQMSLFYLNYRQITFEEAADKQTNSLRNVDVKLVTTYACEDADQTLQLRDLLLPQIEAMNMKFVMELEFCLIKVLASMEDNGLLIDQIKLKELERKVTEEREKAKQEIDSYTGGEVNLKSPKQLSSYLFETLGITPAGDKGKAGYYSVSSQAIKKLPAQQQMVRALLNYRAADKVISTFIEALKQVHPVTGRLHTTLHQTVTATGRLSSSKPNLQNIPSKTIGKELRACFIARPGWLMIGADYSNIELRVAAHLSQDEVMLNAYKNDVDLHQLTASKIFGCPPEDVTETQRDVAKTVNFGLLYGMGAFGLSEKLSRGQDLYPPGQCQQFIDDFFDLYSGVAKFRDELIYRATINGYAETMFGRRRPLPEINSNQPGKRESAKRKALNTPIQGTAADILKIAMVNIFDRVEKQNLQSQILLQVHDELLFEVPESEEEVMKEIIAEEMKGAVQLSVSLEIEMKTGPSWKEAH